jgi:hypothetical protein
METIKAKSCLECGDTIRGRSDKKFCGDQCRNTWNNRCSQEANSFMRGVNHILRKNRKILEDLNPDELTCVSRRLLNAKGFNFEFTTNTLKAKDGNLYFFCYEYGYLPIQDDLIRLIKRTEYQDFF